VNRGRIAWTLAIVVIASVAVIHAWFSAFDHDEIQHLHAAWLVSQGAVPFIDFLEQHHPTLWYALAPLAAAFNSPHVLVFSARLIDLALLACFVIAFIRIVRALFPSIDARWPTLLLIASFMFTRNAMEVRPDPLMNLLLFAGLLAWIAFLQRRSWRHACFAGLLFGLGIAVLQKALVVAGLVALSSLPLIAVRIRDGRRATRLLAGTAVMIACATLPICILFAIMFAVNMGDDFLYWNYAYNKLLYLTADISAHFPIVETLMTSIYQNAVLWIAGTAGLVLMAIRSWRDDAKLAVVIVTLGYSAFLIRSRFPFSQYFLPLLPLLALLSGEIFEWARTRRAWSYLLKGATAAMAIELIVIMLAYSSNEQQRAMQDFALRYTQPRDTLFVPPPYHPIFRRDGAYFWYNGAMIAGVAEKHAAASPAVQRALRHEGKLWTHAAPRLVFIDSEETKFHPHRWSERKVSYELTGTEGWYRLKPQSDSDGSR
jgi:hypothetical protein